MGLGRVEDNKQVFFLIFLQKQKSTRLPLKDGRNRAVVVESVVSQKQFSWDECVVVTADVCKSVAKLCADSIVIRFTIQKQ